MSALVLPARPAIYVENVRGREPAYWVTEADARAALAAAGVAADLVVRFADDRDAAALSRADAFVGGGFDPRQLLRAAPRLRIVHSTSAGVEKLLPLDWLPDGAVLTNSSGIHAEKAREYIAMALLMLNDAVPAHVTAQRARTWRRRLTTPIRGKRVLVFGVGALGTAAAEAAKLLGLEVWGIRRSGAAHPAVDRMALPAQADALLPDVDFLVLTSPLTAATRGFFDARRLDRLKPAAGIINISRAAVIDGGALVARLGDGRLGGAVLDVFDAEPLPPDSPLWDTPNLIVTPHMSADNPADYAAQAFAVLADNLARLGRGQTLRNVVDPALGY